VTERKKVTATMARAIPPTMTHDLDIERFFIN
jgi:hypothetical protein